MSLIKDLLETPPALSPPSNFTVMNGVIYLASGTLLVVWPGVCQTFSASELS